MSLVCPSCGTPGVDEQRFCARCGMPLTYDDVAVGEVTERQARARKVSPQYGEGPLVKVGWARNQAEAELLAGMLLEEGIPSVVRRNGGFDVPDFLAAGPRDILVAESGADMARDMLRTREPPPTYEPARRGPTAWWVRALASLMVFVALGSSIAAVIAAIT
jgi:zinc-ribbon domain